MLKIVAAAFLTLETVGPWLVGDNTGIVTSPTLTRREDPLGPRRGRRCRVLCERWDECAL